MEGKVLVEARNVTKRFPGVLALDQVSLRIVAGKVNALVGENGAGKSTLMNIISGVYPDYEGDVLVDGEVQHFHSVTDAQQRGIAIIHQELCHIPYLNIAENIFLGREPMTRLGLIDHRRMHREAKALLEQLHLDVDTHTLMVDLRVGQQQLVEIAKALSLNVRALIMDEPTSSLTESETELLFGLMAELTAKGVGIVYISHKMAEVWRLADFVTIMRDGCLIAEKDMKDTNVDEIVQLMVGREKKDMFVKGNTEKANEAVPSGSDTILSVEHLYMRDAEHPDKNFLNDISFSLRKGEVLGFYGLMGAGRTEMFESIFGLHPTLVKGTITIDGRQVSIQHPEDAVKQGLALCPEDRKTQGLVLGMSIKQNTTLTSLEQCLSRLSLLDDTKEQQVAELYRKKLSIKSYSVEQLAGQLSGGNQQKIVLAKWLLTNPKVLILDEPTRGIDINAKNEIYRLIDSLAAEGMAIMVASSELPEIMAIADRIITLRQGTVGAVIDRKDFKDETILKASLPVNS